MPIIQTPWLRVVRERLANQWAAQTGHLPGCNAPSLACSLTKACPETSGHLSLPCSLQEQANHIGILLISPSFDGAPNLFLKLYVMILGEFNAQLSDLSDLMKLGLPKPPRQVALWANCWAKHSLKVLVQHHPRFVFADEAGPDWAYYKQDKKSLQCVARDGTKSSPQIIDTDWFCNNERCDLSKINASNPPVIVVPPLSEFLSGTSDYFQQFISKVLVDPCVIRQFETTQHVVWQPHISSPSMPNPIGVRPHGHLPVGGAAPQSGRYR